MCVHLRDNIISASSQIGRERSRLIQRLLRQESALFICALDVGVVAGRSSRPIGSRRTSQELGWTDEVIKEELKESDKYTSLKVMQ